jgi:hypothetical protein
MTARGAGGTIPDDGDGERGRDDGGAIGGAEGAGLAWAEGPASGTFRPPSADGGRVWLSSPAGVAVWASVAGGGATCSVGFTGSAGSPSLGLGGSLRSGLSVATGLADGCAGGNSDSLTSDGSIAAGVAGSNGGGSVGALTAGESEDDWPGLEATDDAEVTVVGFGGGAARSKSGWPSQTPDASNRHTVRPNQPTPPFAVGRRTVSRIFVSVSSPVLGAISLPNPF